MTWLSDLLTLLFRRTPPTPVAPPAVAPALFGIELMRAAAPYAHIRHLDTYVGPLNAACRRYAITTSPRYAAFLAQVAQLPKGQFGKVAVVKQRDLVPQHRLRGHFPRPAGRRPAAGVARPLRARGDGGRL